MKLPADPGRSADMMDTSQPPRTRLMLSFTWKGYIKKTRAKR